MRILVVGVVGMLLPEMSSADDFNFVLCADTNQHISVQKEHDHYLVHVHLRVQNQRGKQFFGRIRLQNARDTRNATFLSSSTVTANTDNDLWSMYFRVPALEGSQRSTALYQLEVGKLEEYEIETHPVSLSFAWRIEPNEDGSERMVADVDGIPLATRFAQIEGNRIVITYSYPCAPPPGNQFSYSIVDSLETGMIPGERSLKRLN